MVYCSHARDRRDRNGTPAHSSRRPDPSCKRKRHHRNLGKEISYAIFHVTDYSKSTAWHAIRNPRLPKSHSIASVKRRLVWPWRSVENGDDLELGLCPRPRKRANHRRLTGVRGMGWNPIFKSSSTHLHFYTAKTTLLYMAKTTLQFTDALP